MRQPKIVQLYIGEDATENVWGYPEDMPDALVWQKRMSIKDGADPSLVYSAMKELGGVSNIALCLSEYLEKQGWELRIVTMSYEDTLMTTYWTKETADVEPSFTPK